MGHAALNLIDLWRELHECSRAKASSFADRSDEVRSARQELLLARIKEGFVTRRDLLELIDRLFACIGEETAESSINLRDHTAERAHTTEEEATG